MIDLVPIERYSLGQRDVDLVRRRDAAQERRAVAPALLRHCKNRRDHVAGMCELGTEEGILEIQLGNCDGVRPSRPFGVEQALG